MRAGAHGVGRQKQTPINDLVRLAVPVGMKREQIEESGARLVTLFAQKGGIPELGKGAGYGKYELVGRADGTNETHGTVETDGTDETPKVAQGRGPIAIGGMAGRDPEAKKRRQMWGKRCPRPGTAGGSATAPLA